jgi:pyridoxamine 5'-phosphate oxidase
MSMQDLRKEYSGRPLDEGQVAADPIAQFRIWFDEAVAAGLREPNAMTLATVSADFRPAARVVLLKSFDEAGFVFFTNYESRKGRELDGSGSAALVFYWGELERQVRIEGSAERVDPAESDAYFSSRPAGAKLGAWASPQSRVIADRTVLDELVADVAARFAEGDVERPPHWGGYRVRPTLVEFWQGRPSRLHDRVQYRWSTFRWVIERLAP